MTTKTYSADYVATAAEFRALRLLGCRVSLSPRGPALFWPDDRGGGIAGILPRHFARLVKAKGLLPYPQTNTHALTKDTTP